MRFFKLFRVSSDQKNEQLSEIVSGSKQTKLSNKTKADLLDILNNNGKKSFMYAVNFNMLELYINIKRRAFEICVLSYTLMKNEKIFY